MSRPRGRSMRDLVRPEPEDRFLQAVLTLARYSGWETHHERDSRRSSAGWPDLELLRPPRHIRAECKREDKQVEPGSDQERILRKLRLCIEPLEVYTWTRRDWGDIQRILARRN